MKNMDPSGKLCLYIELSLYVASDSVRCGMLKFHWRTPEQAFSDSCLFLNLPFVVKNLTDFSTMNER